MPPRINFDVGQAHLKNFLGEGQPSVADQLQLSGKIKPPAGSNQMLKDRRDQGMGTFGTDEYYENKQDRDENN